MSFQSIDVETIIRDIWVEPSQFAKRLAEKYGYLPYMVERYIKILGFSETHKLLEAFEKPLKPVVRTNTRRISPEHLASRLEKLGFRLKEIPWAPYAFRVVSEPRSPSIGATHEYLKGLHYVHGDAVSLIPGILLTHSYDGDILDACAAPGGKATHIAMLLRKGRAVANDLVLYRLKALIGHVARMRLDNIIVTWADARKLPGLTETRYKRVLLDVPCSGEGTIMFDPGRKTRATIKDLARIVKREIELLIAGIEMLEPGGVLAYVTCSIAPEENEYVVSRVLELRDDIEVIAPPVKLFDWSPWLTSYGRHEFSGELRKCIRVWPHLHGMIGFTTCLLRRKE